MKTLLILVDGMRPDALAGVPEAQDMIKRSTYTLKARTVMPSVTLPCHVSLFHSVDPMRHGTTTNTYAPQVRPINGLCDVLAASGKKCAFFYNWEQLRDLARPGSLAFSFFHSGKDLGYPESNEVLTEAAAKYLSENPTDFAFLYLGNVDETGHAHGWMGEEYLDAVKSSWKNIETVVKALDDDYTVIVTADHGGHDRHHGLDIDEDMTTPIIIMGKDFEAGKELSGANITDIAPTVATLLGVEPDKDWEGRSLI